jgi:hypothetical protein
VKTRLPRWTWVPIVLGGVLTYMGVGVLLLGSRFRADLENFWENPAAYASGGAEAIGPFVLLLIPAVLGAIWTRETLGVIFTGLRRKDPPKKIAKDVAAFALSCLVLVLVGLFSSSKRSSGY